MLGLVLYTALEGSSSILSCPHSNLSLPPKTPEGGAARRGDWEGVGGVSSRQVRLGKGWSVRRGERRGHPQSGLGKDCAGTPAAGLCIYIYILNHPEVFSRSATGPCFAAAVAAS